MLSSVASSAQFSKATHCYQDLIDVFEQQFYDEYNTRLIKGEDEPIYLPATQDTPFHQIIFAHGYYASALHEIAHWCIAGPERQLKEDWGYWYLPDGRTAKQQKRFEQVEVKPQALEWAFCVAAGFRFNVSADNLSGEATDYRPFKRKVHSQVLAYLEQGFPMRGQQFISALQRFYQTGNGLTAQQFEIGIDE